MKPRPLGSIAGVVRTACRHPWLVLAATLVLCVLAGVYISGNFRMTSDTTQLFSPNVPWRQHEIAMTEAFPQNSDNIVAVIDGATPEIAEAAAAALTERLTPETRNFAGVRRPDGGSFFAQNGLLFLSTDEVIDTSNDLVSAQPFLGPLAADPSLRGVMSAISTLGLGVNEGGTTLDQVKEPIHALADAMQGVAAGKPVFFSWQQLFAGDDSQRASTRRFVLVQPRLDYEALTPGADATEAIRAAVRELNLDAQHGVRVRLTGPTPLSDEEFASITERAWLVFGSMGLAMAVMLWLAVRSVRLVIAILVTTLLGLVLTTAVGLAAVHRLTLISVAFIPLFVGLGVDFGIQFSVRFRAERLVHDDIREALAAAGASLGRSLALAAAAITLGFFAFLPTPYVGVSELGVISGLGMIIGLVLALTLLPALITLLNPPRQPGEVGSRAMAPLDRFLTEKRKLVLWGFAISTLAGVASLPFVQFDFNPLHLRNPKGEAMSTLLDIMRDPDQTPNKIDVLAPSLPAADRLAARLGELPEVDQTVTLSSFVPKDQEPKLAAIMDAQFLLDLTLNPIEVAPPPTDEENVAAMQKAAADLRTAAATNPGDPAAKDALRLAAALEQIASGPPDGRTRAADALIPPLNTLLDQVRSMLLAQPVTLDTLPDELKRDWVTADGRARVQVAPKGDSNDNAVLKRFSKAVQQVAPDATGPPISIQAASNTVSHAFILAGVLSLVVISALLIIALRSIRETLFTLAPIVVAGFLTFGTCVLIDQPINFANIIAFPLLFGVGVAFHIYFVMAWRGGATNLLQSSLARGVFFSALTTGAAFGALMFSSHPGTASMGKILMVSLIWTLVAALIFEPALLGPHNPKAESTHRAK